MNAFTAYVNVGFFRGAEIADPDGLLEGTGKSMRHVKLRPGHDVDAKALMKLIETAYTDMKGRLKAESFVQVLEADYQPSGRLVLVSRRISSAAGSRWLSTSRSLA